MMFLSTEASLDPKNEGTVLIRWATGYRRRGILKIKADHIELGNRKLIGELVAVRYLLLEKNVHNKTRIIDGKGLCLQVSLGAIKKLAKSKSSKSGAFAYSALLRSQLRMAEIKVVKQSEYLPEFDEKDIEYESVVIDDRYRERHTKVETGVMGDIYVTSHAVERYAERLETGELKRPWQSLMNRLMRKDLEIQPIPDQVLRSKRRKYGNADIEVWGCDDCALRYILVIDPQTHRKTLVSVFRRPKAQVKLHLNGFVAH